MAVASPSPSDPIGDMKMENEHSDSKPALTPPTSESTGKKDGDDSGSELSDLEPEVEEAEQKPPLAPKIEEEEDDDAEIVPDHYYEGGEVPVFKPVRAPLCNNAKRSIQVY